MKGKEKRRKERVQLRDSDKERDEERSGKGEEEKKTYRGRREQITKRDSLFRPLLSAISKNLLLPNVSPLRICDIWPTLIAYRYILALVKTKCMGRGGGRGMRECVSVFVCSLRQRQNPLVPFPAPARWAWRRTGGNQAQVKENELLSLGRNFYSLAHPAANKRSLTQTLI